MSFDEHLEYDGACVSVRRQSKTICNGNLTSRSKKTSAAFAKAAPRPTSAPSAAPPGAADGR
ncbi:MAG: hypothetical protein AB7O59_08270 [Pirellulales bacterium]